MCRGVVDVTNSICLSAFGLLCLSVLYVHVIVLVFYPCGEINVYIADRIKQRIAAHNFKVFFQHQRFVWEQRNVAVGSSGHWKTKALYRHTLRV